MIVKILTSRYSPKIQSFEKNTTQEDDQRCSVKHNATATTAWAYMIFEVVVLFFPIVRI